MGTAAASAGAAGPSEGLRAGRSSGRTEAGTNHGERTTRPRDYGSGPTRQSDDLDSEPDYLLRPTRHGQGTIYNSESGKDSFYLKISEDTGFSRKIHKTFRKTVKTFRKTGKCTIRPVIFPPRRI